MPDIMELAVKLPVLPLAERRRDLVPSDAAAAVIAVGQDGYLMQHRDDKPGVFFPGHWGLFGGAFEPGETPEQALIRELREELSLSVSAGDLHYRFTYEVTYLGHARIKRSFYALTLRPEQLPGLRLGEGQAMEVLTVQQIFDPGRKLCPYDAFAMWMHLQNLVVI